MSEERVRSYRRSGKKKILGLEKGNEYDGEMELEV